MTVWCNSVTCDGFIPSVNLGYDNLNNFPSSANRPVLSGNVLNWIGPVNGGPSTLHDVPQSRILTPTSGRQISGNGTIVQGESITGKIQIVGTNVTVMQCAINGNGEAFGVDSDSVVVLIEDCVVFGPSTLGNAAVLGQGTFRRCNFFGFENGCLPQANTTVIDCWIHDLANTGSSDPHIDGIFCGDNVQAIHNSVTSWDTSCVFFSANPNGVVDRNLLINDPAHGNTSVCIHGGSASNTATITNNILQAGNTGYFSTDGGSAAVWFNNRDYVTGNAIPSP